MEKLGLQALQAKLDAIAGLPKVWRKWLEIQAARKVSAYELGVCLIRAYSEEVIKEK